MLRSCSVCKSLSFKKLLLLFLDTSWISDCFAVVNKKYNIYYDGTNKTIFHLFTGKGSLLETFSSFCRWSWGQEMQCTVMQFSPQNSGLCCCRQATSTKVAHIWHSVTHTSFTIPLPVQHWGPGFYNPVSLVHILCFSFSFWDVLAKACWKGMPVRVCRK